MSSRNKMEVKFRVHLLYHIGIRCLAATLMSNMEMTSYYITLELDV